MTIAGARAYCKAHLSRIPRNFVLVAGLILASSASFGLGVLAGREEAGQGSPFSATLAPSHTLPAAAAAADTPTSGDIVASKNGTKYYLSSCSGASRISSANKITFASADAAREAGYTPASNCKGI